MNKKQILNWGVFIEIDNKTQDTHEVILSEKISDLIWEHLSKKEKNYTIIDLEEANMLQKKYLSKLNINNIEFHNNLSYKSKEYDFCISNYAFSECNKDIQRKYLDDIVLKSKHGYMINNRKEDYSKGDLLDIIPNSKLLPEIPLTGENNYVIYW